MPVEFMPVCAGGIAGGSYSGFQLDEVRIRTPEEGGRASPYETGFLRTSEIGEGAERG
jgi:hypothetical protein